MRSAMMPGLCLLACVLCVSLPIVTAQATEQLASFDPPGCDVGSEDVLSCSYAVSVVVNLKCTYSGNSSIPVSSCCRRVCMEGEVTMLPSSMRRRWRQIGCTIQQICPTRM
jgi:hypothetical protein